MCLLACVLHTLRLASISRAHSVNFVFLPFLFVVATFMCHASCGSALNDSQKGKVTRSWNTFQKNTHSVGTEPTQERSKRAQEWVRAEWKLPVSCWVCALSLSLSLPLALPLSLACSLLSAFCVALTSRGCLLLLLQLLNWLPITWPPFVRLSRCSRCCRSRCSCHCLSPRRVNVFQNHFHCVWRRRRRF